MTRKGWLILGGGLLLIGLGALAIWINGGRMKRVERERWLEQMKKLELAVQGEPPPKPPARFRELGPSSNPGGAREAAVLDLLSGRKPTLELPVLATDPGAKWDGSLRDRLAPMPHTPAPSPRPGVCDCPPDDPLCVCL